MLHNKTEESITLRRGKSATAGGVIGVLLFVALILWVSVRFIPPSGVYSIIYAAFVYAFALFGLCISLYSIILWNTPLILSGDGVRYGYRARTKFLPWSEVADWGISYKEHQKSVGALYYIYFSGTICEAENARTKKLRACSIKALVVDKDLDEIRDAVISFCSERTKVKPFLPKRI